MSSIKEASGYPQSCSKLYNSHILQNTLGDSHKALGNFQAAEAAYIESSQMMPSMLLPRYLLAKLYHESGENEKARQTAEDLLNSPVKVESSATREIIGEMDKIIGFRMNSFFQPVPKPQYHKSK
jgi:O-antigen polymerase